MIQQKAARFVFNDFARLSSVTTMLELLGWDSLEKRRDQLTLMMLFKIINNLMAIPHSPHFTRSKRRLSTLAIEAMPVNSSTCMLELIHIAKFPSNQTLKLLTPHNPI